MIPYTFEINDTSFASIVKKYSYSTDRIPVESPRITTMDGVDHVAVIRYKGVLTVEINPQDETTFNTFCAAVAAGVLKVKYRCLQTKTDVTQYMTVSGMPGALVIKNASRNVIGGLVLTFTEL